MDAARRRSAERTPGARRMTDTADRPGTPPRNLAPVTPTPDVEPELRRAIGDSGLLVPMAVAVTMLVTWEVLSRLGVLRPVLFSSPLVIGRTLVTSFASGEMPGHLLATLTRTVAGLTLGAIPGLLLG